MVTNRDRIVDEIEQVLERVDEGECFRLIEECKRAERIMVMGRGRIGLALCSFSMRMNQIGKETCVVDETTSFRLREGDLFLIGNMTGNSPWANHYLDLAHSFGASVFFITSLDGAVSGKAEGILHVRARAYPERDGANYPSCQPMSSTAEQCVWMLLDAVAFMLQNETEEKSIRKILKDYVRDLRETLRQIPEERTLRLIARTENAKSRCLCGTGRAELLARAFAMRLYHLGLPTFVCGETGWRMPAKDDLLICCPSPGEEELTEPYLTAAKRAGAETLSVLCKEQEEKTDDFCIPAKDETGFCHAAYVLFDDEIARMMRLHDRREEDLARSHTNMQ